jgi:hypothetical protein
MLHSVVTIKNGIFQTASANTGRLAGHSRHLPAGAGQEDGAGQQQEETGSQKHELHLAQDTHIAHTSGVEQLPDRFEHAAQEDEQRSTVISQA